MATESLFCARFKFPLLELCLQMSEWAVVWQAAGIVLGLFGAAFAGLKFFNELKRLREQREEEASLKRTEFFLAQHRRLFDDKDLALVLCHLDGDDEVLASEEFWDRNRKFLTFIEEIEFLINSKKVDAESCYYMFGYYALCARNRVNFNYGIDASLAHWKIFQDFCGKVELFNTKNPNGPSNIRL